MRPGQPGTKRLVERYGDRLVCVRYRYDAARGRRYKTVELVVDEQPWAPSGEVVVGVRVRLDEPVLRRRVKAAGGMWNASARAWELPYGAVRALALEDRVVAL